MIARLTFPTFLAASVLFLASCSATDSKDETASSRSASDTQRAVVLDFGSLDTLAELNLSNQVVGVLKQSLPEYLSFYAADHYQDIGGLKSPDLEKINQTRPSVIIISGRLGDARDDLANIAPVMDVSTQEENYLTGFDGKVRKLAQQFDASQQAQLALTDLHNHIRAARQRVTPAAKVLVVTHNDGNYMLNRNAVVYEVLQIPQLEVPAGVQSETRGTRTFTPLSIKNIQQMEPDILLVIDRSAAIGNGDSADAIELQRAINEHGGETEVTLLSPALWYLSGGGLQSLKLQIDEVMAAL